MFKAIKEFFLGKPIEAPKEEAPYKVETPLATGVDVTPTVNPQITDAVTTPAPLPVAEPAPVAEPVPAKKPRAPKAENTAVEKAAKPKKPAAMTAKKPGRKPKAK